MKFSCLFLFCSLIGAAEIPKVLYTKSFPGSTPAFTAIWLDASGAGEYKEAADDDNPLKFQIKASDAAEIFAVIDRLDRFKRPLESNLKVAKMGLKTFRFENGSEKTEVSFNYSEDPDGRALADWFDRIAESEQAFIALERAAKYDKLGVNKALLALESSMDRKRLVITDQFVPILERISKNEGYLHMARTRAANLMEPLRFEK
jgi:hypothetical protein